MNTGVIRDLVPARGFGWIVDDADRARVFFPARNLQQFGPAFADLGIGQVVTFERVPDPRPGRHDVAVDIRVLD